MEACQHLHAHRANSSPVYGCHWYRACYNPRNEEVSSAGMLGSQSSSVDCQLRRDLVQKAKQRKESLVVKLHRPCEVSYLVVAQILAVERQAKGSVEVARRPAEGLATEIAP